MKNLEIQHYFLMLALTTLPFELTATENTQDKIIVNNDFALQYNEISGEGKSKSSLSSGLKYYDLLNVQSQGKIDEVKYKFNIGLKATDDTKKDVNTFSLTNIQAYLSNKTHTLRVGDVYESFSQYSLNTALKGASYRFIDANQENQVQLIYGIAYPRWDSFYAENTKSIRRDVYGIRYKNTLKEYSLENGISVVHSEDSDRIFTSDMLYKNTLYTFDTQYNPIRGLTLNAELSHSQNERDSAQTTPNEDYSGEAIKLRAVGDQNPSRVVLEYERIDTNFITFTGAATPDREKFKTTWRYKISKKLTTNLGFLWFRNNLNSQLAYGKNVYRPSVGVTYKKLFDRKYNVINVTYKVDKIFTQNNVDNHMVDVSVNDKFGEIDNVTNISYYQYKTDGSLVENKEVRANTRFAGRVNGDGYMFKPYIAAGTWSNRDELQSSLDSFYETAIGVDLDIPKQNISSSFKVGKNLAKRELLDDSSKVFANLNVYYKPRKFLFFDRALIYASILYNDFGYATANKNFREQGVTAGMRVKF
jgi:hypothetical protein